MASANGDTLLYSDAFGRERPKATAAALQGRARRTKLLGESIAGYISERAAAEDAYVKALQKLARKPIIPDSCGLLLGDQAERVRHRLQTELQDLIRTHENLARRLESEIAGPMREGSRAGETSLRSNDTTASSIVKDFEDASSRVSKLQAKASIRKPEIAAKVSAAEADLARASRTWRSSVLPNLFAAYESADRARLESIKEGLAKYETLQSDIARERLESAERGLNDVITWDLDGDAGEWLRTEGGGRGGDVANRGVGEMGEVYRTPDPSGGSGHLAPSSVSRPADRAPSVHSSTRSGGGGFLSKLAPKINRSRSSSHPSAYGNLDGPSFQPFETPAPRETRVTTQSDDDSEALRYLPDSSPALRSSSPDSGGPQTSRARVRDSIVPSILRRKGSITERHNKDGARPSYGRSASSTGRPSDAATPMPQTIEETTVPMDLADGRATAKTNGWDPPIAPVSSPVDAEGFTIPPQNHDQSPWQSAPATGASLMDNDVELDTPNALPKAANLEIQKAPIQQENDAEREAALQRVKSTLLSGKAPSPGLNRRSTRGRRDVRVTTFNPIPDDMPLAKVLEMQGHVPDASLTGSQMSGTNSLAESPLSISFTVPPTSGRAMSMMSTSSSRDQLSASLTSPFENPDGTGLRAIVSEVVHILYKGGEATRVMVTGEIGLLLRDSPSIPSNVRIRINNYEQLEKSAPNTQYLTAVTDSPGEYTINSNLLTTSSTGGQPTIVLRYHLHINDNTQSEFIPVQVNPQWKCEPTQTSILISYHALPASRLVSPTDSPFDEPQQATLHDITMLASITSPNVSNIQSRPNVIYSPERRRMQWRLDDLSLTNSNPQKVLARFTVDEPSQIQPVAIRWRVPGRLVSSIGLDIVDNDGVAFEELVRAVQGKVLAAP